MNEFKIDGLTLSQIRDLNNDGRSPKTGRKLPRESNSALARLSKQSNWNKLVVKGAACQLTKIAHDLQLVNDQDLLSLTKAISKLETLLLNRLSELYEAQRAYELAKRAKLEK